MIRVAQTSACSGRCYCRRVLPLHPTRSSHISAGTSFRREQLRHSSTNAALKKPRALTMQTSAEVEPLAPSPSMRDSFSRYADYLNQLNDKRERIVKASRDVTINSKKVIFQIHRLNKENKDDVLEKAGKELINVKNLYISKLVKELDGTDFWKLRRAYMPSIQEYVEAASFCEFCKNESLLNLEEVNASLLSLSESLAEPLQINILDYLLGLADLTGELMRLAIGRISDGELEHAQRICQFVRCIYRELTLVVPYMDESTEMKKKMDVMLQSVLKIENACYSVHVRSSEYVPFLGSEDNIYAIFGLPEFES